MLYSRFYHKVLIKDDVYAIFNSLLMDIVFVSGEEIRQLDNFISCEDNLIDSEFLRVVLSSGIVIKQKSQDAEALSKMREIYEMQSGKITVAYFLVTSDCNLACKYCFIENPNCTKIELHNMSDQVAITAIHKYIDYLHQEKVSSAFLIFYGGEPILNWNAIKRVVEYSSVVSDIDFQYTIVTNATLLDENKLEFIRRYQINLGVSIDGPKEINDSNRVFRTLTKSVYDTIIPNISRAMKNGHVCLSITLAPSVVSHKSEILKWLEDSSFDSIGYNLYCYTQKDKTWETYSCDATDFIIESYERLRMKIFDDRIERKIECLREGKFKFTDCGALGGNQVVFKPNGDICVCHAYEKTNQYTICNILTSDFSDIVNSKEFQFWMKRIPLFNEECLSCEALFCCGGGCVTRAETLFGERECIDRSFCIHTKKILMWFLQNIM